MGKIRRKLEFEIGKKQIKNKFKKTFTPNGHPFNKFVNNVSTLCGL